MNVRISKTYDLFFIKIKNGNMKTFKTLTFISLLLTAITVNAQNGLVAYWSFDEMVNDTIFDNSGNANHGTNYGANLVPGKFGNALSFDGFNDYARIPKDGEAPPEILSTLGKGTISLWFKVDNIPTDYGIAPILFYGAEEQCNYFDAANQGLIIELGHSPIYMGSEAIFFTMWKNGCTLPSFCFDSDDLTSTNQWHHYVAVVGDDFNTGYLDGLELTSRRYSFGNSSYSQFFEDAVVHEKMWLGKAYWDNTTQYFDGTIDELRIYDRPLTSAEVLNLYNNITSVNENKNEFSKIKIFPNPVKDVLYFDLSEVDDEILFFKLINTNGKILLTEKIIANTKTIDLTDLQGGIYFIDFVGEKRTYIEKVLISD